MTTPYHLTARAAATAALEAHATQRLCAQTPLNDGAFYAVSDADRPELHTIGCAIGVAVPRDLALAMQGTPGYTVENMVNEHGFLTTDDVTALTKLQNAHDNWCGAFRNTPRRTELEQEFLQIARTMADV